MRFIIILLIFSLFPMNTEALVFGGGNLGIMGYESHSCFKPTKPYKPYSFSSQWEVESYNSEVEQYNSDMDLYISCIKEYIENAKNDRERILEKINEAISDAKSPY